MGELLDTLEGWSTIRDVAAQLSRDSGKTVKEAEVLDIALRGHLTLSVNFVQDVAGTPGSFVPRTEPAQVVVVTLDDNEPVEVPRCTIKLNGSPYVFLPTEPEKVVMVNGTWDLPLVDTDGGWEDTARLDVEHRLRRLTDAPGPRIGGDFLFVNRPDGTWRQILDGRYLPDDADLVVRTAALDELLRRIPSLWDEEPHNPPAEEPLSVRSVDAVAPTDPTPVPFDLAAQDLETNEGRKAAVEAFLSACNRVSQQRILKKHISQAMGHGTVRSFQYWLEMKGPPKETLACDQNVRRVLAMSIPDFLALLRCKRYIKDE